MRLIDGDELEARLNEHAKTAELHAMGIYKAIQELHKMETLGTDVIYCSECAAKDSEGGCPIYTVMEENKIAKEYWYCGLAVRKK